MRAHKDRVATIELFLRSGDLCWVIPLDETETAHKVQYSLSKAIKSRFYFEKRCEAFSRNGRTFLIRKDMYA